MISKSILMKKMTKFLYKTKPKTQKSRPKGQTWANYFSDTIDGTIQFPHSTRIQELSMLKKIYLNDSIGFIWTMNRFYKTFPSWNQKLFLIQKNDSKLDIIESALSQI